MQFRFFQQRIFDKMLTFDNGRVLVPTGGGKTYIMIRHSIVMFERGAKTILVVAPRILLANQLCSEFTEHITNAEIMHVHSGETHYFSSTNPDRISDWVDDRIDSPKLIFTTYNSLGKIVASGIDIDVMYCDEAHNSTRKDFFKSVAAASMIADKKYFFTATPKNNKNPNGPGMNNIMVYGPVIEKVPAQELVESGCILPPTVIAHETDAVRNKDTAAIVDSQTVINILDTLDESHASKVLVAAPSTKILWNMLSQSDVIKEMEDRGYEILHITSKHGAYVNRTKVNREVFFDTLQTWGKDPSKKFVLFHYSILSEGINVPGLTHCILLRNLPMIEMAQTIGRVIRLHHEDAKDIASGKIPAGACQMYRKSTGFVTVPVHQNHGKAIAQRLQRVVDAIFIKGQAVEQYS
jgi:superfamily II DNA or RNA helicase